MSKLNRIAMAFATRTAPRRRRRRCLCLLDGRTAIPRPARPNSDAQIDNLSGQFAKGWITTPVDYESLLRPEWVPEGSTDAMPVTLSPTTPVREQ